jgi:nucleoid-associated protein YgaU
VNKIVAMGVAGVIGLAVAGGCSSKKPLAATPVQTQNYPDYNTGYPAPPQGGYVNSGPYGGGGNTTNVVPVAEVTTPIPTVVPTTPSSGSKYTVKKGDTLWSIAQRSYGDGKQYKKIVSANPSIKGDKVNVGQVITLP